MARLAPKSEVLRALFALSGNRCAIAGCPHELISEKGIFIAQVCHIEAAEEGGPRYNPHQSDEERRSFENLLLLCYRHHRETDDVNEFCTERMKQIKKEHEDQFRKNQYQIAEPILEKIKSSIQIQLDQLLAQSTAANQKLDELLRRTGTPPAIDDNKIYIAQLDAIKDLKKQGKYKTAIDLLLDFKQKNWDEIDSETKYKVLANIGICYLNLHDKSGATDYLIAIKDVGYESPESLAMLCLGYSISGMNAEFDDCFQKAIAQDKNNINLWVAYIERHKKEKTAEHFVKVIPTEAAESVPVLFSLAVVIVDAGKKKEGIELLRKALTKQSENPDILADTKAMIATCILQEVVDPFKFAFKNFSKEELNELNEAGNLLTEVWEQIGDTEQAKYKWFIILNRGVVRKLTNAPSEAAQDFQKAWELSHEFLPFQNLLFAQLQLHHLSQAAKMLANPQFAKPLTAQQTFELQTIKARLLCLEGNFDKAITAMASLLDENNEKQYQGLLTDIIAMCFENRRLDEAASWCELLLNKYPTLPAAYIFKGFLCLKCGEFEKALENYDKATSLITAETPAIEIYELASGLMEMERYEKAIPLFEQLANKNVLNSFSRGLVHAYYKFGDLQAALALAEYLDQLFPHQTFIVEIISNIYQEAGHYDKAINIIEQFLPFANPNEKSVFSYRCARLYSFKRDWNNARRFALAVLNYQSFSLFDSFTLAWLLVESGQEEKGLSVAYDSRTRFYDQSISHLNYTRICIRVKKDKSELFPTIVRAECAIIIQTENNEQKTFLITEKSAVGENVIKPNDPFALQLIGKTKDEELVIDKGHGVTSIIKVIAIIDIYTHAFQESISLFETRFAGQHGVSVFRADPGQPGDQMEDVIRSATLQSNTYQKQPHDLYYQRKATIGVLANMFKRNPVKQWFAILSSPDISAICFTRDESPAVQSAITNKNPLIIDLTALLTVFFIYRDNNIFIHLENKLYVSQSTIDDIQEFYEELKESSEDGIFSLGYQNGSLVGHTTPKETVRRHMKILQDIITWCKENCQIAIPLKLLEVKRDEREKLSSILGKCFYDTMLLAQEHKAAVICDDDIFKDLLRNENIPLPFSIYQLTHQFAIQEKIGQLAFEKCTMQLVGANYIHIPISGDQLWSAFENSGFQITKSFTVAVHGLLVMRPEFSALQLSIFLQKLYLQISLPTTREQTLIYLLMQLSKRPDFETHKKLLITAINKAFYFLPNDQQSILQILQSF